MSHQTIKYARSGLLRADRAVGLGLILTELVINASKYAYDGSPGPLVVTLSEGEGSFRLTVEDKGKGRKSGRTDFGSRMINAMVAQLQGHLEFGDIPQGTSVTLIAPTDSFEETSFCADNE